MQETRVWSLGREDPQKEMAIHSSILAWRIPWTEEPGRLQSTGSQRVGHNWVTSLSHNTPQARPQTPNCLGLKIMPVEPLKSLSLAPQGQVRQGTHPPPGPSPLCWVPISVPGSTRGFPLGRGSSGDSTSCKGGLCPSLQICLLFHCYSHSFINTVLKCLLSAWWCVNCCKICPKTLLFIKSL